MAKVVEGPNALAIRLAAATEASIVKEEFTAEEVLEAFEYVYACVQRWSDMKPARKLN